MFSNILYNFEIVLSYIVPDDELFEFEKPRPGIQF